MYANVPGYVRQDAIGIGVGAREIIKELVGHLAGADPIRIGRILRPYERSAYVTVRGDLTESLQVRGPRLILLGDRAVSGPLTVEVGKGRAGRFDPSGIDTDAPCRLRTATTTTRTNTGYVLVVGDTLEVTIDRSLLESTETDITHVRALAEIEREGASWRQAAETLDFLIDSNLTDGLGWAVRLEACVRHGNGDAELERLAATWHRCVTGGFDSALPAVITDLLGRGPGATPSGDDILTGILLTLLCTTSGQQRSHVLTAGETLVATATDRTTTISTALLAQAALGRSPDPVTEAIRCLLRPAVGEKTRMAAVRALTERGHTSGVDILVGILLTILMIGPSKAA